MPAFNERASGAEVGGGVAEFMWKWSQDVPVEGVTLPVCAGAARPSFPQSSVCARVWVSIYDGIFGTHTHVETLGCGGGGLLRSL